MKFLRFPLAALVALAALAPFASVAAHAQKPALTENIDEKGRVPYYDAAQGTCQDNGQCTLIFKTVPAGFRLVITYASGNYFASTSPSVNHFNLVALFAGAGGQGNNSGIPYMAYLTPTSAGGANIYAFSSPLTFYAEPNSTPQMVISNVFGSQTGMISGYLVSIP